MSSVGTDMNVPAGAPRTAGRPASAPRTSRRTPLGVDPTIIPPPGEPGHGSTASLRRRPVRMVSGRAEGGYTDVFELICRDCGDHLGLAYSEACPGCSASAGLTRSRRASRSMKGTSDWPADGSSPGCARSPWISRPGGLRECERGHAHPVPILLGHRKPAKAHAGPGPAGVYPSEARRVAAAGFASFRLATSRLATSRRGSTVRRRAAWRSARRPCTRR
jgi:hypothetical protein